MTIRLFSILLTILSMYLLGVDSNKMTDSWNSLFTSWLFCHFTVSIIYSKKQFESFSNEKKYLALLLPGMLSLSLYIYNPGLLYLYFGLHHTLTEVYGFKFKNTKIPSSNITLILIFALQIILYITTFSPTLYSFTYIELQQSLISLRALIPVLLALISLYLTYKKGYKQILYFFPELCFYIIITTFYSNKTLPFTVAIFYHLTFWFISPLLSFRSKKQKAKFIFENILFTGLFLTFSTSIFPTFYNIQARTLNVLWERLSTLWGFIHISYTFITSRYNPNFILRRMPWYK